MPAPEIEELRDRDDLPEIRSQLEQRQNVVGTGVGYRYQDGEQTDEPVVMAYVEQKQDPSQLPDSEEIPSEINGVAIDVYEDGQGPTEEAGAPTRDTSIRPLPGGALIAAEDTNGNLSYAGTACVGVYDNDNSVNSVLIAGHSAEEGESSISDVMGKPIYNLTTQFGTVNQIEYDSLDGSGKDYAVVGLDNPSSDFTNEILGVGEAGSYMEPSFDKPMVVACASRSANGLRKTKLVGLDVSYGGVSPLIKYEDVTEGGDSGGCVGQFDDNGVFRPAALHIYAGSYGMDLSHVMSRANLSWDTSGGYDDPSHSNDPYIEGCVIDEDYKHGIAEVNLWNAGDPTGGVEFVRVDIKDPDGIVVDSKVVGLAGNERRTVNMDLPDNGEYTFHTSDTTHPHNTGERSTVATNQSIETYEPGIYVRENGEWVLQTDSTI